MEYPDITHLYKYRAFTIHSLSILVTRRVWFANPDSFNDPFDCKTPFVHEITGDKVMDVGRRIGVSEAVMNTITVLGDEALEIFKIKWKETWTELDEELKKVGVFTLSELDNNILMWGHYADCHKGFCIEYERTSKNELGNYGKTRRVQYRPDYPIIDPTKTEEVFDLKFFTKALDWAYEKEWRLIKEKGDVEVSLPDVDITAIIFGTRMLESHKEIIRKVTSDSTHIKYRQAVILPGKYELGIIDL